MVPPVSVQRPTIVVHYCRRADSFFNAARDLDVLDQAAHGPAIGLLAVHGCIALADALLVSVEGARPSGADHAEAVRRLRDWCAAQNLVENGIRHFEWLLARKTHFSYGKRLVRDEELQLAKIKMEQFLVWVLRTFPAAAEMRESTHA